MRHAKKYIYSLTIGLLLTAFFTNGCSFSPTNEAPASETHIWNEQQALEGVQHYLVNELYSLVSASNTQLEQVRILKLSGEETLLTWKFHNAALEAWSYSIDHIEDGLGETVDLDFLQLRATDSTLMTYDIQHHVMPPPSNEAALRQITKYRGNHIWEVTAGDLIWQVNESNGEVEARSEAAMQLWDDWHHRIFQNIRYGYKIEVPSKWPLIAMEDGKVLVYGPEPQVEVDIDTPHRLFEGQSLGEAVTGLVGFYYEVFDSFSLIGQSKIANGDYRAEFVWQVGSSTIHSIQFFHTEDGIIYIIGGSAPDSKFESYVDEFTKAYDSFIVD